MSATRLPFQSKKHGREVVRCSCLLIQFKASSGACPKCGAGYEEAEEITAADPVSVEVKKPEQFDERFELQERMRACKVNIDVGLGVVLKLIRTASGMSQRDIAKAMGKPRTYFSKLDNGKVHPNLGTLYQFCKTFEMTPYGLILMAEAIQ